MAVNIDTVYQKVLAMANKEQRGYITPQEFNLYADQAQLDIFERYFHDIRQIGRRSSIDSDKEFSSAVDTLDEKLSIFRVNEYTLYPKSKDGTITLPSDLYKLGEIYYTGSDLTSRKYAVNDNIFGQKTIEVEEVKKKDLYYLRTLKTTPTKHRPIYVRASNSEIKIYPNTEFLTESGNITTFYNSNAHKYVGAAQYFDLPALTTVTNSNDVTYLAGNGNYSYIFSDYNTKFGVSIKITGNGIPDDTLIESQDQASLKLTLSKTPTIANTITAKCSIGNTFCNYIKKPTTPDWAYTEINGTALYNSGNSIDFELHASEESMLVSRIVQLAGITLKDNNLLQIGSAEESKILQTQKQ